MQFKIFRADLLKAAFKKSSVLFIFLLLASSTAFATEDVQETDGQTLKEMLSSAEKLSRRGDIDEAEKILRRAIATYPKDVNVRLGLAHVLIKQKHLRAGFDMAYAVAEADPKNSYALAILGIAYLNAGNFTEAKLFLYNAANLNKREALAWAGIGMLDFYENRVNSSLGNMLTAVNLDRRNSDYVFAYGQIASRDERYKEAAEAYKRFLEISSRNDTDRREKIKGLIQFLEYLGNRTDLYAVGGGTKTVVPVKLVNDRPVLELKINGKDKPLRFILDTGSGVSVISKKTAKELGIKTVAKGGMARAIGGDGKFEIVYGFLRKVEIGDVNVSSVPVYIREFHNVSENIDGYIGLALISKFLTTIDYGNLTFSLSNKDFVQFRSTENEKLTLPLRLTSSGFLSGEVLLEGLDSSLNFIVDTGASISVISDDVADKDEIRRFVREEKLRVFGAAGVTEEVSAYLLPRVTFGNHSRERIKAIALDLDLINESAGFVQAGILGGNFLKNYRVTFDFQNSKVLFVPVKE